MEKRLQQFLAAENITQSQFADTIGVAKASISHIIAGRNKPGYDFICNTMKCYPTLNMEWLLTGKGKMYRNPSENCGPEEIRTKENDLFCDMEPEEDSTKEPVTESMNDIEKRYDMIYHEQNESPVAVPKSRKVMKIILLYDDGTFQDCPLQP